MWSLSVLRVLLLARCPALTLATQNRETVQRIWASHHTCILLSFFQSQCVVYVKMPFHPPNLKRRWYSQPVHVYVGSTAISAAKREFNRFAKLKQVQNQAVHVDTAAPGLILIRKCVLFCKHAQRTRVPRCEDIC